MMGGAAVIIPRESLALPEGPHSPHFLTVREPPLASPRRRYLETNLVEDAGVQPMARRVACGIRFEGSIESYGVM